MINKYLICLCSGLGVLASTLSTNLQAQTASSQAELKHRERAEKKHTLTLNIKEKGTNLGIPFATIQIPSLGYALASDINGLATLPQIPVGRYTIEISSIGYSKVKQEVLIDKNLNLAISLSPETLGLAEVVVTAKRNTENPATSSTINRQAIDHLQAMSLSDIVQLVPGQLMTNTDLTSKSNLQIRSLVNNNTNAFGTSIIVDGVPQSNNANMSNGGFSSTNFVGTDLRSISADDLESVEVVRGIPSAEYGDLTSGLVITKSRVGISPWNIRAKLNPSTYNLSASKGLKIGHAGVLNLSVDYAQAYSEPRMKTRSYDRYNASLGYSTNLSKEWNINTKLRYSLGKDWSGQDPDAIADGSNSWSNNHNISLSHNGKISLGLPLAQSISYTIGATLGIQDSHQNAIISSPIGLTYVLLSRTTGYHITPIQRGSYYAGGGTESRPFNFFAKIGNQFYFKISNIRHNISMGLDYALDYNSARGYYNDDDLRPLRNNENGRPRAFSDIPPIHRISAYWEDNLRLKLASSTLKVMAGLRFTALQPTSSIAAYSLSPRLNASYDVTKWFSLSAGIGWNAKTPGLDYLYPDKKYTDNISANYNDNNNPKGAISLYHTYVQDIHKSQGLKNAVSRKIELGAELKLGRQAKLSITAYQDDTDNGFSALSRYTTFSYNLYTPAQGLIIKPGTATTIDYNNPASSRTVFVTTGEIGNTSVSRNRGIELELELGEIKVLRTQFFLSGAYSETLTYDNGANYSNPRQLPAKYTNTNTIPFKLRYPAGLEKSEYRRWLNTLRLITHIPELNMVASLTGQVIWYNYTHSIRPTQRPIAWLDTQLQEHPITETMLSDNNYSIDGVRLSDQTVQDLEAVPTTQPITWQLTGRLTKELGRKVSLSVYANNMFFYEPFLTTNRSMTLTQRNTGTYNFGAELSFKL